MSRVICGARKASPLNESPSEKEGKSCIFGCIFACISRSLNESPSEKEGKSLSKAVHDGQIVALNESPSEKEGK